LIPHVKAAIVKTSPIKVIHAFMFSAVCKKPAKDFRGDWGVLTAGACGGGAGVDAEEFPADDIVLGTGSKPRYSVRDAVMSNKIVTGRLSYLRKKRVRRTSRLKSHAFP
jgi:hypothetical protein